MGRRYRFSFKRLDVYRAAVEHFESATYLDAFAALGVIDDADYEAAEDRLAGIGAMLTRLMQRQQRLRRDRRRRRPAHSPSGSGVARPTPVERPRSGPAGRAERVPAVEPPRSGVEAANAAEIEPTPGGVPAGAERPPGIEPRAPNPRR